MKPDELKEYVLNILRKCADSAPVTLGLNSDRVQDLEEICGVIQAELETNGVFTGDCQYGADTNPGGCLVITVICDSFEMYKNKNSAFLDLLKRIDRLCFRQPEGTDMLAVDLIIDGLWVEV